MPNELRGCTTFDGLWDEVGKLIVLKENNPDTSIEVIAADTVLYNGVFYIGGSNGGAWSSIVRAVDVWSERLLRECK